MRWLSTLVPEEFRAVLSKPLKRLYLCVALSCVGAGLTLSLFVIYLHDVRHFSITFATLLLAASAVAGLVTSPLSGTLVDRYGPIIVIVVCTVVDAGALVLWAFARHAPQVVAGAVLLAVFGNAGWGPGSTLLSRLVPEEHRQRAFGVNFMLVNLGIGLGGLISATIVDLHHPFSFTVLYLLNATAYVGIAVLYLTLWSHGRPIRELREDPATRDEGWREVLKDHRLVFLVLATLVMMIGGYGSMEAGFSLFVVNDLHLSVHVIGVIFFFDTSTIVAAQLFILNRVQGRSRTRVMALAALLWFFFWMVLFVSLHLSAVLAVIALSIAMTVFAVGETMMSPIGSALVNDLAPEHLRGRYNSMIGLSWGLSATVAPAITAFFFSVHLGHWWPLFVGGASLSGSFMMLRLRRRLSTHEDGTDAAALLV
ncbi:MAG: MFS transporter [Acidimicrobiales bacterium]|jgi:MFS family permease